jgi:hypothetical protein
MNLTWFHHLNTFLPPDFGDHTISYVVIHSEIRSMYVLKRSTYVLYDNKDLSTYLMIILLHRDCTSFYKSDKNVRFSALQLRDVGITKFNKLVKKYIWYKIESGDLFK